MGLTSHISCIFDAFSSYRVYFSLITSLTMMVLFPVNLVRVLFSVNSVSHVNGSGSVMVKLYFPFCDGKIVN